MNCGPNVRLKPANTIIAATFAQMSEYIRPVIFGHQKCRPAKYPMIAPPTMMKWKWATKKYVSGMWTSTPSAAVKRPVRRQTGTKPGDAIAQIIGAFSQMSPRYIVAAQLKVLTADGMATAYVRNEKTSA